MDNNQDSIFEFEITEEGKSNFSAIARWANINAIVGFIGLGVSVIAFVAGMMKVSRATDNVFVAAPNFLGVIIGLIIGLVLNITLINAAINIKLAVEHSSQSSLVNGLTKLATYFKIFGIILIVAIVFVSLALVVVLTLGTGQRF